MKNAPNFRVPFYLALCIKISVGSHKRTLILIQRLAFFLCPESLAPQGFFHDVGCMERAFPLFFGRKRRLMLVSPCFTLPVGCMIKRLLVVGRAAVLYWVHMQSSCFFGWSSYLSTVCGTITSRISHLPIVMQFTIFDLFFLPSQRTINDSRKWCILRFPNNN